MENQNQDQEVDVRLTASFKDTKEGKGPESISTTLLRLVRYLKDYQWPLIGIMSLVILRTILDLAGPILLGRAIDVYITAGDMTGLMINGFLMLGVYLGVGTIAIIQGITMVNIGQNLVATIRGQLFAHIQTLSMDYHHKHPAGDLMSRVSNDTETINRVMTSGFVDLTTHILSLTGIIISMFILSWPLALGVFIIIPILLFIVNIITQRSRIAFRNMQRNLGNLNALVEESITGIQVAKAFSREAETIEKFKEINIEYQKAGITAEIYSAVLPPMFTTMSILTIAIVALLGGWLALQDLVQVGIITTFLVYIRQFFNPLRAISALYNQLQSALAGSERIFKILDEKPSVQNKPKALPLDEIKESVAFEQVDFAYYPHTPVLSGINLEAKAGEIIALVGPTGSGKTTIINLLTRFYDVQGGTIQIDNIDIRDLEQDSLRQRIGLVPQDTFLFSDTIKNNIRYGRLEATDGEVIQAARQATAHRFIRLLPQGYETQVTEQSNNLSQGQKQLIAVARTILADPRILILDEATSSVDTRTEMQLQKSLPRLMQGRTTFVIAHRLSTLRHADRILFVDNHYIVEEGTHSSLLAQQGAYYSMYMSQYRHLAE